jgi:hypothetical protein
MEHPVYTSGAILLISSGFIKFHLLIKGCNIICAAQIWQIPSPMTNVVHPQQVDRIFTRTLFQAFLSLGLPFFLPSDSTGHSTAVEF